MTSERSRAEAASAGDHVDDLAEEAADQADRAVVEEQQEAQEPMVESKYGVP